MIDAMLRTPLILGDKVEVQWYGDVPENVFSPVPCMLPPCRVVCWPQPRRDCTMLPR